MANFTLKLGTVDLSQYIRVAPGDGLDPYGEAWEEPVFSQSAAADGQPFIGIDTKNREMTWPLYLKGVDKDTLAALRQQIVQQVRYGPRPLRVEWKDQGSTNSTFYDVGFARLDEKFNYRLGAHNYADAALKVWLQPPWGHTATERVMATAAGASGALYGPIASFGGDMDAQVDFIIGAATRLPALGVPTNALFTVLSITPSGWLPYFPAPSLTFGAGATLTTVGGFALAQSVRMMHASGLATPFVECTIPGSGSALFNARVMALVRSISTGPIGLQMNGPIDGSPPLVKLASTIASQVRLIDLGVIPRMTGANLDILMAAPSWASSVATQVLDVAAVFVLPETRTRVVVDNPNTSAGLTATYAIKSTGTSQRQDNGGFGRGFSGVFYVDGSVAGPALTSQPGAGDGFFAAQVCHGVTSQAPSLSVDVRIRERFTFNR